MATQCGLTCHAGTPPIIAPDYFPPPPVTVSSGVTVKAAAAAAAKHGGGAELGSQAHALPTDEELIAFAKATLGIA